MKRLGIDAQIITEDGREMDLLPDAGNLVSQLVAQGRDASSRCLAFIDPYGDTVFNQLQIPVLIEELKTAITIAHEQSLREHGEALIALAQKAMTDVHQQLRFIGD